MISNELQYKIHTGDPEAFQTLFFMRGKDVYLAALDVLGSVPEARGAVKRIFILLQRVLKEAPGPIDVDARIAALTKEELLRCAATQTAARSSEAQDTWDVCCKEPQPVADAPQAAPVQPSALVSPEAPPPEPLPPMSERPEAPPSRAPRPRRGRLGVTVLWILVVLLALTLLWLALDILMNLQLIPRADLGYTWFNEHVFRLFSLA